MNFLTVIVLVLSFYIRFTVAHIIYTLYIHSYIRCLVWKEIQINQKELVDLTFCCTQGVSHTEGCGWANELGSCAGVSLPWLVYHIKTLEVGSWWFSQKKDCVTPNDFPPTWKTTTKIGHTIGHTIGHSLSRYTGKSEQFRCHTGPLLHLTNT